MQAVAKKYLRVADICTQLGVAPSTVRRWITHGLNGVKLKAIRPGSTGSFLVTQPDLDDFLTSTSPTEEDK